MKDLGYYNGRFGAVEEMTVPFNDRVHFFRGQRVRRDLHTQPYPLCTGRTPRQILPERRHAGYPYPARKAGAARHHLDMVRRVDSGEQFVYLQATRGTQPRDHVYPEDMHANIRIMLRPQTVKDVFHEVRAITAEDTRFFHNNIKTLNDSRRHVCADGKARGRL